MDLKELTQISGPPERHWYYAAKFDLLAATLRNLRVRRVADVGAGSGVFSRLLLERTECREAICVDPAYESDRDVMVSDKILRFRRHYEALDVDLILLMDVLEHVDDDVALLAKVAMSGRPGASVFITVPAFGYLWSAHDVFLGHRRRYTAATLASTMSAAGLTVERVRYFYASIFPLAALMRLLTASRDPGKGSDLRPTPIGSLLTAVLKVERLLVFPINRLAGLSVVGIART